MRLATNGELDAHREESPEPIGSEAVEDIGEAGEIVNSGRRGMMWNRAKVVAPEMRSRPDRAAWTFFRS
jgi:hypothetical protein